jgi:hypothetical protein
LARPVDLENAITLIIFGYPRHKAISIDPHGLADDLSLFEDNQIANLDSRKGREAFDLYLTFETLELKDAAGAAVNPALAEINTRAEVEKDDLVIEFVHI